MNLKPGRELDALVAEQVFGMTFDIGNGPMGMSKFPAYIAEICRGVDVTTGAELTFLVDKEKQLWKRLPNYSTDIAVAWEVVEKLDLLSKCSLYKQNTGWTVDEFGSGKLFIVAESAPHAICLAALNAVGKI